MYKFIIGDKEFSIGKLCLSNSNILAYEDQAVQRNLDGVNVLSSEIIEPIKTLVKNNVLSHWSFKETLGRIAFNLSIAATTEEERLAKLSKVKSMLADESVIQIKDSTGTKFYRAILLLGTIDESIDTNSFNIIYGFKKDDVGAGLYPLAPSFVKTMLNGKDLTITFKKGANATLTKVVVEGIEYSTGEESITIPLPNYNTSYSIEVYSVSDSGILGDVTILKVKTPNYVVIPTMPTNVIVKAVIGKYVTLTFTKGTNATKTEISIGDIVTETFEEEVTILMGAYNTSYDLKLRSVSVTGAYSDYTDVIKVTTLEPIVPLKPTINVVDINEDVVTFSFTKGKDAISTEFIVDGVLYTTQDTFLVVKIGAYGKTFTYKARSISYTENYSEYTTEASSITDIIPSLPTGLTISINGKVATLTFVKATDAMTTELLVDGKTYTSDNNTLIVDIGAYSKEFSYKARSISATGNYSDFTVQGIAKTGDEPLMAPSNITVSISKTVATFNFVKANNAVSTEFLVNGVTHSTDTNSLVVDIGTYSTLFTYKARSKSAVGNYSAYSIEASAKTGSSVIPGQKIIPTEPTNLTITVKNTTAKFNFTKGTDAISTQFIVDNVVYETIGSSLTIELDTNGRTFSYKARSKSETGDFSSFTTSGTATTDSVSDGTIIPVAPKNVVVVVSYTSLRFTFTKAKNASLTEILVNGKTYTATGTALTVNLAYSTPFTYKARTKTTDGQYSDYTFEESAATLTSVDKLPAQPTESDIKFAINKSVVTFTHTNFYGLSAMEILIDNTLYTSTSSTLVVDLKEFVRTFTFKSRVKSTKGIFSLYSATRCLTTNPEVNTKITFNLNNKIAGSIEECPITLSIDDVELSQEDYEKAKGTEGIANCQVLVNFNKFIQTYYGSRTAFINDLVSINFTCDGGGYVFDYEWYEYSDTKVASISSSLSDYINGANQLSYKVDNAANFSLELEVKTNILK